MPTIAQIADFLEESAPARLAEEWDNVGLLVGNRARAVERVMTCLTITPTSAREAMAEGAGLIVTHHPLPFRPLKRLTTDTVEGRLLLDLIAAGVAIHSPHTAFDSARAGINQQLAAGLELQGIAPLTPGLDELGSGRFGRLACPCRVGELVDRVKRFLRIERLQIVGGADRQVSSVGVACGSAGQFLPAARSVGCEVLLTGETSFHTCLEAESTGMSLLLVGHYASERFGVEALAAVLARQFPDVTVWASRDEADPLSWL
jgi:dinuclear metal center YbgI/SA1388 family protein